MENFSQVWTVLVVLVTRHIRLKTKIKLVKTGTVDFLKTVTIFRLKILFLKERCIHPFLTVFATGNQF